MRARRPALFVAAGLMLGTGVAAAQADLAKALVGTWKGELQTLTKKGDPVLTLIISSVKQEGGKWVADARLGGELVGTATLTTAQAGRSTGSRDRSVKLEKKE
jgi:hypothetical protein